MESWFYVPSFAFTIWDLEFGVSLCLSRIMVQNLSIVSPEFAKSKNDSNSRFLSSWPKPKPQLPGAPRKTKYKSNENLVVKDPRAAAINKPRTTNNLKLNTKTEAQRLPKT